MRSVVELILMMVVLVWVTPLKAADVAAGKELFGKKCASCHGVAGEGKDSVAKTFKVELKHLGGKEAQSKSDAELTKIILEGAGKMKGVKDVDAKGADDVVAYMRTLKK
jgi:mono/diheme cytochrome c family protein